VRTLERERNASRTVHERPGRAGFRHDVLLGRRARQAPGTLGAADVVTMQRTVGNKAVQRALAGDRPTLRMGSSSPAVKGLQEGLISAGAAITADGSFGPKTHAAVAAFQKAGGLIADGVVGPKTWAKVDAGGVTIGGPGGATAGSGTLPTLASAKLAELKTLLAQASGKTPPATAPAAPAQAGPSAAPVAADAWGHDWWDDVSDAASSAVDTVSDAAGAVADTVSDAAGAVVDTVSDAASSAVDAVSTAAGAVVDTVTETVGAAATAVADAAGGVWNQMQAAAEEVGSAVASVADDVKDYLGDGYAALQGILAKIASGLGLGDLGILDGLIQKLKQLVNGESDQEGQDYSGAIETIHGGAVAGNGGCDRPPPASKQGSRRMKLAVDLGLGSSTERGTPDADAPLAFDSITGKLGFESETKRDMMPIPESAYGYAGPIFNIVNGLWSTNSSWWNDKTDVSATVSLTNVWDIQGRGRTSITSAQSEEIHAGNWTQVVEDLTPAASGVPKRHTWWAPGPTKAHEEFHCKDYTDRAKVYLNTAQAWLASQQIDVPFWDTEKEVRRQVKPLLEKMAKDFTADAKTHLDNGGEPRAYSATRSHYEKLVADIKARAATEGWK
jgi:hypothetical protein